MNVGCCFNCWIVGSTLLHLHLGVWTFWLTSCNWDKVTWHLVQMGTGVHIFSRTCTVQQTTVDSWPASSRTLKPLDVSVCFLCLLFDFDIILRLMFHFRLCQMGFNWIKSINSTLMFWFEGKQALRERDIQMWDVDFRWRICLSLVTDEITDLYLSLMEPSAQHTLCNKTLESRLWVFIFTKWTSQWGPRTLQPSPVASTLVNSSAPKKNADTLKGG